MIPSVFLAGITLAGFGIACYRAGKNTGVLAGVIMGVSCVVFGVLFVAGSVIA